MEWQYDALGRRIRQTTSSWLVHSNLWVVTEDLKFVSDPLLYGRHVVDLNTSNNVAVRSYVWGLDLSETLEGAGGVGGLLWVTLHPGSGPAAGTHFCAYDGNGNVVVLVNASDGSETPRYEYGPFAEPIRVTGPAANQSPFRFSTKRTDPITELVLYEYRAYNPSLGRWLSRDPIEETGGLNVYGFVGNGPVQRIDPDGRVTYHDCPPAARRRIQDAIDKACRRIRSTDFSCCMIGSKLAYSFTSGLQRLCRYQTFYVKCMLKPLSRWGGCARGDSTHQTIEIYNECFTSDACGWGEHYCIIGHEMLHLVGPTHKRWDRLFNRLHQCLKCPKYMDL